LKVKMGVITNERDEPQHTDYKLRLLQDGYSIPPNMTKRRDSSLPRETTHIQEMNGHDCHYKHSDLS